jgi:hypothetical protein
MRKKKNQPQKRKRERTARKTEEKESSSSYLCFSFIYRACAAVFPRLVKERSNVMLFCLCRQKAIKSNKKQPLFFAKNALVLCPYLLRLRINIAENARKDTYRYKCSVCSFSVLVSSRWRSDARIERSKSCCFFGVFSTPSSISEKAGF